MRPDRGARTVEALSVPARTGAGPGGVDRAVKEPDPTSPRPPARTASRTNRRSPAACMRSVYVLRCAGVNIPTHTPTTYAGGPTSPALPDRQLAEAALVDEIRVIWAESGGTYGSPRVCAELRRRGRVVNHVASVAKAG